MGALKEESRIEDLLDGAESLVTSALISSDVALWDWRTDQPEVSLSASYYLMLGYEPFKKQPGETTWIAYIHPKDHERLRSIALDAVARKTDRINAEFRAKRRGGDYCWLWIRGQVAERSRDGRPTRMLGSVIGIKEQKKWEQALHESQRRYEVLLDSLPGMAYRCRYKENEWTMEFVSEGCLGLTGFSPAELTENRENYMNLIHPDDREFVWSKVEIGLLNRSPFEIIYRIRTVSGEDKWVWERGTGVFSKTGKFEAIEGFTTDITAYQKAHQELKNENLRLKSVMQEQHRFGNLIGKSSKMRAVYNLILQAAASSASVIIYGESGTGKELVAQAIHELSQRKNKKFVSVNCGAIPSNLLESEFFGHKKGAYTGAHVDKLGYLDLADGGTLFLDEIGEIHPNMQVKLLRAIEGGGYTPLGGNELKRPNVRVVCATNQDLKRMVWDGRMRMDFFYRIHIIPIQLPPLRDRKEDISLLVLHFLERFSKGQRDLSSIPGDILRAMHEYDWPGNVRELQNLVQRYVTLNTSDFQNTNPFGGILKKRLNAQTCIDLSKAASLKTAVQVFEKEYIQRVLQQQGGNRTHAARRLGIGIRTLHRKLKEFGISR